MGMGLLLLQLDTFRDSAMERASEELRQKRGTDSLLDIHEKKLKKKKSKEEEADKDQPKVGSFTSVLDPDRIRNPDPGSRVFKKDLKC